MKMLTFNRVVATEPFEKTSMTPQIRNGMALIEQKIKLTALKVVVGNQTGTINKGDIVYLDGTCYTSPWAKKVMQLGEMDFILVPEEFVQLVMVPE